MRRIQLAIAVPLTAVLALSACSTPLAAVETPITSASTATSGVAAGDAGTLLAAQGLEGKSGAEVVDKIKAVPTAGSDVPTTPVTINSATVVK